MASRSQTTDPTRYAWLEPGAHAVADGVWRIPLPLPGDGLRAVNVYAVADGDGVTLVDAGWALDASRAALRAALGQLGLGLGDIRRFLVTHEHRDHYTQAVALRRDLGTRVLIGAGERPAIEQLCDPHAPLMARHLATLTRHGADAVAAALLATGRSPDGRDRGYAPPDAYLEPGEKIPVGDRILEAVETPGHTRGHLVFLDRAAGLLFAGDHVLPHITPSVAFEADPPPLALESYLRSLRLVRTLPDTVLLPAHGPAGHATHARVDALLDHHDRRLAELTGVLRAGATTAYAAAGRIGWTSHARRLAELDPFNQMLAVFETALHLDLVVHRGGATVRERDGVLVYALA